MSEITREQDEAMTREIDAHGEHLKAALEMGDCPKCGACHLMAINPRDITFKCGALSPCGWSAVYPIRTLGNSERATRDEALDLVAISEREVIKKAKEWANATEPVDKEDDLMAVVTLLESREANK